MLESALLFLVFFGPLAFGCVEPWSLAILQAALLALPILAARRPASEAPRILLSAVGVILLVGTTQALNLSDSDGPTPLLPFTASATLTKRALLLWASYAALLWSAPRAFQAVGARERFAWAVVLGGFTISAIGLVQSAQGNRLIMGIRPVGYGHSPFGPYYNNGHAASLLAVCGLMGLGLFASKLSQFLKRRQNAEAISNDAAVLPLLAFAIGIIFLGLFVTHNRGSVLALGGASLIVSLMFCGNLKSPPRRWGARAVIIAVFLAAGGAAGQLGLIRRGSQSSIPQRLSMYRSSLRLAADAPLWGTGLGTVITVFHPYKSTDIVGVVDHVHSDWLELPLQAGVPAAALVFMALAVFGLRVYDGWRRETSEEARLLVGGGAAAALCFVFHAAVDFTWQIPANAVIFLLMLCWLWSHATRQENYSPTRISRASGRS